MNNLSKFFNKDNWISTVVGIIGLILTGLVMVGKLTREEADNIEEGINTVATEGESLYAVIAGLVASIVAIFKNE